MLKKKVLNYQLDFNRSLGRGAQGEVVVAINHNTKQEVAVKVININKIEQDEYTKRAIFTEIQLLKCLRSQNIVNFIQFLRDQQFYYIVQELCQSDLRDLMMQKANKFTEEQAINILFQICNGFTTIIKQGIIHRDLKPQNILIKKNRLKIADFGLSKRIHNNRHKNISSVGTPVYMSLQLLKNEPYSSKCDIWALGVILYQLLHGKIPWEAYTQYELVRNIQRLPLKIDLNLNKTTQDFLRKCLQLRQKNRMSWDQLFRHQIFAKRFDKCFKPQNELQDRLKTFMNQLRYLITSQNINLYQLFLSKGYKKQTELTFQHFKEFLQTIDSTITSEEQIYIFQKLDLDDSNTISFYELETEFKKHNIPLNSLTEIPLDPIRCDQESYMIQIRKKDIEEKMIQFFYKMEKRMIKNNLTLNQVFKAYDLDKNGYLSQKEFGDLITKVYKNFNENDIKFAFQLLDVERSERISYEKFEEIFIKVTGKVSKDFMTTRNKQCDTSSIKQ